MNEAKASFDVQSFGESYQCKTPAIRVDYYSQFEGNTVITNSRKRSINQLKAIKKKLKK